MNSKLFWSKVSVRAVDECWPWLGRSWRGYGRYNDRRANRIAYELENGPLAPEFVVRHTCDNPACCNPAHLEPGTQADNIRDAQGRGRLATGERNGNTRLTQAIVDAIRASPESCAKVAARYSISKTAAHYIRTGRSWKVVATVGIEPTTFAM